MSGLADLIIDYASARLDDEPFSTSPTEGVVQWLLHRRWERASKCAGRHVVHHLMLQVRTATVNATLEAGHGSISRRRRSFLMAA